MTKQEFKCMCNGVFLKRGFIKRKSSYYRVGVDGLRCKLSYQSSYGDGYYINCDFCLSRDINDDAVFDNPEIMGRVFRVLSKDTIKGKAFMTSAIYYIDYDSKEIEPFIELALDKYVLPPLEKGRSELLCGLENGIWHFAPLIDKAKIDLSL